MRALYFVLLGFRLVSILLCAVLCFLIAARRVTPTLTYVLWGLAFCGRLVSQVGWSLFYPQAIYAAWLGLSVQEIVISQLIEAFVVGCFLTGYARTYRDILRGEHVIAVSGQLSLLTTQRPRGPRLARTRRSDRAQ